MGVAPSDLSLHQVSKYFPEMMPLMKGKEQGKGGHDRQRAQLLQTFRSVTGFGMFGELPVDLYDRGVRVWVLERPLVSLVRELWGRAC